MQKFDDLLRNALNLASLFFGGGGGGLKLPPKGTPCSAEPFWFCELEARLKHIWRSAQASDTTPACGLVTATPAPTAQKLGYADAVRKVVERFNKPQGLSAANNCPPHCVDVSSLWFLHQGSEHGPCTRVLCELPDHVDGCGSHSLIVTLASLQSACACRKAFTRSHKWRTGFGARRSVRARHWHQLCCADQDALVILILGNSRRIFFQTQTPWSPRCSCCSPPASSSQSWR